ncbi:hypothetical protein QWY93_05115 [Echinicola jeungdonensis]|uniref:Lipoprotein n=1 Tax=Echinicola jeungdonensis TaxID=709343 RepID=A0ABV5J729_9BACT|nr:hypothetical protein [Echinicola jeungdonensis]MDN3668704.1 hypothetical protein [Echinicola jeungdonensis]
MRLVIATLVVLCISGSVFACKTGPTDLGKEKEKKPTLLIEKVGKRKLQLRSISDLDEEILVKVKDGKSKVLYKEVIKGDKIFRKNFDMSALAEGAYEIEVSTKKQGMLDNFKVLLGERRKETKYLAHEK